MNDRETVKLVARREVSEGLRSRAWRASVAIQVAIVAAIAIISLVTSGSSGPSHRTVAVSGPAAAAVEKKASAQAAGYGIALLVSVYVLWTFGRLDGVGMGQVAMMTAVLGFPSALGAALARLVV